MPLYEYRCTSCSYSFEKIQSFSAEPERVCPKCQGELIRPVTAPALRFEGAGWYVNDYAGKGGKKSEPAAASSDGAKEAKSDSKTESKTESKAGASDSGGSTAASAVPAAVASSTPSTTAS